MASSSLDDFFEDDSTRELGNAFFVARNTSFSEQISDAATVIARSLPESERSTFVDKVTAVAHETEESEGLDKSKVVDDLFTTLKGLRIEAPDREFEAFVNLLLALVFSTGASDEKTENLANQLAEAIVLTQGKTVNPTLAARYSSLCTLLNALPVGVSNETRLGLVLKLVLTAAKNDDFVIVSPVVSQLDASLSLWGFGLGQEKEKVGNDALDQIVSALVNHGREKEAYELLKAHFLGSNATPSDPSSHTLALRYLLLALKDKSSYDFRTLSAVAAVASPASPAAKALGDLLVSGGPADVKPFLASHSALLSENDISPDALEHKLRLIALADLASRSVGQSVAYTDLADLLGLSPEEAKADDFEAVENYVIDAIRLSLISGKLSQISQTFYVVSASPRTFSSEHWTQLLDYLQTWRRSLDAILDTVEKGLALDPSAAGLLTPSEVASA